MNDPIKDNWVTNRLLCMIISVLIVLLGFTAISDRMSNTRRYEYKIETPHDTAIVETMNARGQDGWELVESRRVLTGNDLIDKARTEMIFKRRK